MLTINNIYVNNDLLKINSKQKFRNFLIKLILLQLLIQEQLILKIMLFLKSQKSLLTD